MPKPIAKKQQRAAHFADIVGSDGLASVITLNEGRAEWKELSVLAEPECYKRKCVHFGGVLQPDGTEMSEVVICAAFPKGIPAEITQGKDKHSKPHPRQQGLIVYEQE